MRPQIDSKDPANLAKLPKWAQRRISNLESTVASLTERLRYMDHSEASPVGFGIDTDNPREVRGYLKPYDDVVFKLGGHMLRVRLYVDGVAPELMVMSDGEAISVIPRATNSVSIGIDARRTLGHVVEEHAKSGHNPAPTSNLRAWLDRALDILRPWAPPPAQCPESDDPTE